jgi:hypothetical protein
LEPRPDLGPPRPPSPQPWLWPLVVAACLLVLTAGAVVGMVTTDDDPGATEATPTTGAEDAGAAPAVPPPTVTIGPVTEVTTTGLTDTGFTDPTIEPVPPVSPTTPAAGVGSWPAGTTGYTVVLDSTPEAQGRSEADAAAQRAIAAGLAEVGVLRSSDYSSLRPGFWVAYAGIHDTEAEARAALVQAQGSGFPDAYPRRVSP